MLTKIKNKVLFILMIMMTLMFFYGCMFSQPGSRLKEITPVPIVIEGVEFKVGDSKLGDIINGGLLVSPNINLDNGVDELQLEKMSNGFSYISGYGSDLGKVSFVNNTIDSMNYSDCTISEYNIEFKNNDSKYNNILIDGINFNGMTIDEVKSAMLEKTNEVSEINAPDGSLAVLDYKVGKVSIDIFFKNEDKTVSEVNVEVYNIYFE